MILLDFVKNIKRVGTKLVLVYNDHEVFTGTFSVFSHWVYGYMYVSKFIDYINVDDGMFIVFLED